MKKTDKAPKSDKSAQKLSLSIGDFIRYWGFRRIHGAVWTQLYLSTEPLSCTHLTKKLALSKALISPALEELCDYGLIEESGSPNDKTKTYKAKEDINEVIRSVLKNREKKMLSQISDDFKSFLDSEPSEEIYNHSRIESLQNMLVSAQLMLQIMLAQEDLMNLPKELEK